MGTALFRQRGEREGEKERRACASECILEWRLHCVWSRLLRDLGCLSHSDCSSFSCSERPSQELYVSQLLAGLWVTLRPSP